MNNVRKQQLSTELKNSILSYINSMNFMYGEKFIDTSDLEEKTIFLRKMYEQYKDVEIDIRKIISLYIKTAEVIAEKTLAIHMAESKNNSL